MAGMNTLHLINLIPKFDDGCNYVEWTRSFDNILQTSCLFLSKLASGLEKPEPILRSRESEDPIEGSENDMGSVDEREPSNVDIKAWGSANEGPFSVLIPTTITAA